MTDTDIIEDLINVPILSELSPSELKIVALFLQKRAVGLPAHKRHNRLAVLCPCRSAGRGEPISGTV